ncbi:MAG: toll/interleukin-1 receptor domain-containing protein [Ruminococcus sp.]|nr:toll/interleukin-1 receptor domain-containing protein [Ruminococcus sp.]
MSDIFISHSSKDKDPLVRSLVEELRALRIDVWVDEDVILCGDNILDEIKKGIENSVCLVLILTPAFFESNWTSLELGFANSNEDYSIIPVLAGIPIQEVAQRYPFLLAKKYVVLDIANPHVTAIQLAETVKQIKARHKDTNPLDYQSAVRRLNNFDTPGTNTISILISEYLQICKISISAGLNHAAKIGGAIIDDIFTREEQLSGANDLDWQGKLDVLVKRNTGLNRNITEHLNALMKVSSSKYFSNEQDQKKLIDLSLAAVLNWYTSYVSTILQSGKKQDHYEVILPGEMSYQDFVDMYEIDRLVLRPDLIATPDITFKWYQYNIYTHIAVRSVKTGSVAGYFALLPVTDELFNKIQSGDFKDNDLSTDGIRQYDMADFYKLYVAAVCIHPNHQNTTAFNRLYHALIEMMYELATEREIYITDIITEASTKQGEKLCKILGLKKLMSSKIDTELYTASLLPPSLRLNSLFGHKLIMFYQEKYNEMRELF